MLLKLTWIDGFVKEYVEEVKLSLSNGFLVLEFPNGEILIYPDHEISEAFITIDDPEVLEPDEIVIGEND